MNLCLVELKMKYSFKTGCFSSKLLIEIEAKGDKPQGKSEFWSEHWNEAKEKSMLFRMIMWQLRIAILPVRLLLVSILLVGLMPVELLSIESVTDQDMFFEQGDRLVYY